MLGRLGDSESVGRKLVGIERHSVDIVDNNIQVLESFDKNRVNDFESTMEAGQGDDEFIFKVRGNFSDLNTGRFDSFVKKDHSFDEKEAYFIVEFSVDFLTNKSKIVSVMICNCKLNEVARANMEKATNKWNRKNNPAHFIDVDISDESNVIARTFRTIVERIKDAIGH